MTTGASAGYRWHGPVPEAPAEADLQALRALLSNFGEAAVCARLKVPNLHAYQPPATEPPAAVPVGDELDALIRLWIDCLYLPEDALAPEKMALLERLGLIARDAERPGTVYGTVALIPIAGLQIVCDRGGAPSGSRCPLPPDVLYPPVFSNARHFLESLPATPCDAMLDLGTGSGIAALAGARHASHVWATDITSRAVAFAEWNRRLAGPGNMTVLQGDLFEPVEGLTFDRIVMYPPYVPSRDSKFVFRDGGEDGLAIIRRVVRELPRFLRPGGRFYATLLAFDRQGESFEQRVRRWLGDSEAQFDIGLAARNRQSPGEFLSGYLAKGPVDEGDLGFWLQMWTAARAEAILYASLVIERHASRRDPASVRVLTGTGYTAERLDKLLDWEAALHAAEGAEALTDRLLACRPTASPQCVLTTASRILEGRFTIERLALEAGGPFRASLGCDWWLAQVLCQCDGARSWLDLFKWSRAAELLPDSVTAVEFASVLPVLVRHGLVDVDPA